MQDQEANYCLDTFAGSVDCVTMLAPSFSSAMAQPDFPWLQIIFIIMVTLSYTVGV